MSITEDQLRDVLRKACESAGSQSAWADRHGLSKSFVTEVLKGNRGFGDKALAALGYERRYVRVANDN